MTLPAWIVNEEREKKFNTTHAEKATSRLKTKLDSWHHPWHLYNNPGSLCLLPQIPQVFLVFFLLLLTQALAFYFCRTSIKCSRFPGSGTKLACFEPLLLQLWVSLPGCFFIQLLTPSSCPLWTNCFSSFLSFHTQFPSFSWWKIPARILLAHLSLPSSSARWLGLCYSCSASIPAIKSLFMTRQKGKMFFQITTWLLTTRRWGEGRRSKSELCTALQSWG